MNSMRKSIFAGLFLLGSITIQSAQNDENFRTPNASPLTPDQIFARNEAESRALREIEYAARRNEIIAESRETIQIMSTHIFPGQRANDVTDRRFRSLSLDNNTQDNNNQD
ncbi:hypothetical protein KBC04_05205 [Candidatus Babeliales bacterium]|nr:hypothetical protein [Candidatus Babeliales bacterium]MBP9844143.1 hypothetical protein [Candidatus Babeliales bacterium]